MLVSGIDARKVLLKKFEDPRLKSHLLGIGDQYLQEANWWG
jgi:hypothetical protein